MGVEISLKEKSISKMLSCPARGMGVEIGRDRDRLDNEGVMPRRGMGVEIYGVDRAEPLIPPGHAPQGHGSRNTMFLSPFCR